MMQHDYGYQLYLDNLPSATILRDQNKKELPVDYFKSVPIGVYEYGRKMIYNHLDITVIVHDTLEHHHRVVGFEVEPFSMMEEDNRSENNPSISKGPMYLLEGQEVTYSYRIITRNDPSTTWAMRMDHYLKFGDNNIHMANILYGVGLIIGLGFVLYFLLVRSIGKDFK